MELLLKEIGKVAIFLICAQTLLHFRANDSYEKYIKLLLSMMLMLLLAEPFLNLLSMENGTGFMDKVYGYEQKLEVILGNGLLKEEEVEDFLVNITTEKVEQGVEYIESMEVQEEASQEKKADMKEEVVEQRQIVIETIEIGGENGES